MKKLLILSLLFLTLLNVGCDKKSSHSNHETTSSSSTKKCTNCGSTDTKKYEYGGVYCNTCEVVFR